MTPQQREEHSSRIELGEKAKQFLKSDEWNRILKPILDSMLLGLKDATTIDISSDKKAAIEVKARTEAARYIESIEVLIKGYVEDSEASKKLITPIDKKIDDPLFKDI